MNTILVFIDLTETAQKTLKQAIAIAKKLDKSLEFCHVTLPKKDAEDTLNDAIEAATEAGVSSKWTILEGDFYDVAANYVKESLPDLVLVGTHGKVGLKQNILGSNIYKLVSELSTPTLVLSDYSEVVSDGYNKVLIPVASHPDYLLKVKEAAKLMAANGKVLLFAISKPGLPLNDDILNNIKNTEEFLNKAGLNWEFVKIDMESFSVGYSMDTLSYARKHAVDMIAILTEVSEQNRYFGKIDKENLMINKDGIAILCVGK
jgi:nucleotide-binding universal stress UspA family protein